MALNKNSLDKAAKALWELKLAAAEFAADACASGDFAASERFHMIEAKLTEAYGLGRGLIVQSPDGEIRPLSGGK